MNNKTALTNCDICNIEMIYFKGTEPSKFCISCIRKIQEAQSLDKSVRIVSIEGINKKAILAFDRDTPCVKCKEMIAKEDIYCFYCGAKQNES